MAVVTDEQVEAMVEKMPHREFRNEHGEEFIVYSNGMLVFMRGDETANELVNLFSEDFNIWSADELFKLGGVLQSLALEHDEKVKE